VLPGCTTTEYDLGAARYNRTGEVLPDSVLEELKQHDAILLGAVGDPSVPPGVLERGLLLKLRFVFEVAREHPDIATEYQHVDAAAMFLVTNPQRYDVIVTDNLFGDILTDVAAAVTGGIGLAASGSINPERRFPSMFEPVHGSAPDIAGQGLADPVAAVLSVAIMLDHLGHPEEARRVERAVATELSGRTTGQKIRTDEVGDRLASHASDTSA
jgi:3-isopropylmalate dehydrogenase